MNREKTRKFIQVFRPVLNTQEILTELKDVIESGWIGLGPKTKEFEEALSKYISERVNFIALNSCTSALHLAIKLLNLKPGAKIATTPITFISTNHAILYERCEPVFCDIEKGTGNVIPETIDIAIKKYNISAILIVHFAGYPCDMERINKIAEGYRIPVIEDCAHAFGGYYLNGKKIGDTNNICTWSFHAVKNLCIGDGGAVSVSRKNYYERLKKLRWMGIDLDTISRSGKKGYKWEYYITEIGYKYHLNDILSSIGLVQLRTIDKNNHRRRQMALRYKSHLEQLEGIYLPTYKDMRFSAYHFYPVFFRERDKVYNALTSRGIYPGMHYKRNDLYPMYRKFPKIGVDGSSILTGADWHEKHELTLPFHLALSDDDIDFICNVIEDALK